MGQPTGQVEVTTSRPTVVGGLMGWPTWQVQVITSRPMVGLVG